MLILVSRKTKSEMAANRFTRLSEENITQSLYDKNSENTKKSTKQHRLRTVPTIVIAHTLCASPDTRISYRYCLLIQGYFCAV